MAETVATSAPAKLELRTGGQDRPAIQDASVGRTGPPESNQIRNRSLLQKAGDYLSKMANREEPPQHAPQPLTSVDSGVTSSVNEGMNITMPDVAKPGGESGAPAPVGEAAVTSSSPAESVVPVSAAEATTETAPVESPPAESAVPIASPEAAAVTPAVAPEATAAVTGSEPVDNTTASTEPAASPEPVSTKTPAEVAAEAKKLQTEAYMKITTLLSQDIAVDADPEELMQKLHDKEAWVRNDKTIDYIKGAIKFKQEKVAEEARIAAEAAAAAGVPGATDTSGSVVVPEPDAAAVPGAGGEPAAAVTDVGEPAEAAAVAISPEVQALLDTQAAEITGLKEALGNITTELQNVKKLFAEFVADQLKKEKDDRRRSFLEMIMKGLGYAALAAGGEVISLSQAEATGGQQQR